MKKISLKYIFFIICIYLLVFQNLLQNYSRLFQYFDEILALLVFPIVILKLLKNKGEKKYTFKKVILKIWCIMALLFIYGILCNLKSDIQPLKVALSDALLVFKFFLVYLLSYYCFDENFISTNKNKILFHIKLIIYLLFGLTIFNYAFKIWIGEYRFGIMSNQLFYSHPTYLAAISIFLIAMIYMLKDNNKNNKIEIILLIIMLASTLRFKAIGAAILIIIMILYIRKINNKLSLSKLAILALFIIIIAWNQISYYYIDLDGSARNQLTMKSFEIARDYFPFGTGFGTYGSYISGVYYSNLYYSYGLSNVHGLAKENANFLSDTFWPMIIGQFGLIGTILYTFLIIILFKRIQKGFSKDNINIYISKMICLAYLIISSTSESAFVHPISIPLAIVIGLKCNIEIIKADNTVERSVNKNV